MGIISVLSVYCVQNMAYIYWLCIPPCLNITVKIISKFDGLYPFVKQVSQTIKLK